MQGASGSQACITKPNRTIMIDAQGVNQTCAMINLKSPEQVEEIREVAKGVFAIQLALSGMIRPGVVTSQLDAKAQALIERLGLSPTYKGYRGFPRCITVSINSEVEHGVPSVGRQLQEGDIVKIGLGANLRGWYADRLVTYAVGRISDRAARLIATANDAMWRAISKCRLGNRIRDISLAIQSTAEGAGYTVVRDLVGHGTGRQHHEDPKIPNYYVSGWEGPELAEGMILKPCVLILEHGYNLKVLGDDWTIVTEDGGLAAGSTEVIAITKKGPQLLTGLLGTYRDHSILSIMEETWVSHEYRQPQVGGLIAGERIDGKREGGMVAVFLTSTHAFKSVAAHRRLFVFDERAWQMFASEIDVWLSLPSHSNIVQAYTVIPEHGGVYLVLERVGGGDLMSWIREGGLYRGEPAQVLIRMLDIAIQSARGLSFAHEKGVVHQDVKPPNILLTANGVAKVTDFGLARARVAAGETGEAPSGFNPLVSWGGLTLAFCSPEQEKRQRLSPKTDMWSWAVTVLTMFTGGVRWVSGATADLVLGEYLRSGGQESSGPRMRKSLSGLLRVCLHREPERRPNDMLWVLHSLIPIYEQIAGHRYPYRDSHDA